MSVRHLTASRRRTRKEQLARRHGQRCTYCRRPFATLREATLDHIVPVSLFRTWSVVHLTLACVDCNHAKADRLPLSIALLLGWTYGPDQRDETRHTPVTPTRPARGSPRREPIHRTYPGVTCPGARSIGHPIRHPFT